MEQNYWRKCIACKNEINFSTKYYKCSVSSCDKKRSPAQFCSVNCWDIHRSIMNHMSAGADEYQSPSKEKWMAMQSGAERQTRRIVSSPKRSEENGSTHFVAGDTPEEILVVVSKLKAYVKAKSGLNTSADVNDKLSQIIREHCDRAIHNAHRSERKTLMARDF